MSYVVWSVLEVIYCCSNDCVVNYQVYVVFLYEFYNKKMIELI